MLQERANKMAVNTAAAMMAGDMGSPDMPRSNKVPASASQWSSVASFDELTYWKYDDFVSENDTIPSLQRWMLVSKALHSDGPM